MSVTGILWRFADTPFGVFGVLDLRREHVAIGRWCTAEEDWLDNRPTASCIPAGSFLCRRGTFPRTGEAFEVVGVPGRSGILIHAGNTEEDVAGCILLGEQFGALTVRDEDDPTAPAILKWAVLRSRPALTRFHAALAGEATFSLSIRWSPPGAWRLPTPPVAA